MFYLLNPPASAQAQAGGRKTIFDKMQIPLNAVAFHGMVRG